MAFPVAIIPAVIIFAVIVIIIVVAIMSEKKRTNELQRVARMNGFSFSTGKNTNFASVTIGGLTLKTNADQGALKDLGKFKLFMKGHGRTVYNLMKGRRGGVSWVIFDYRYTIGGGKNQTTYTHSVFVLDIDDNLPRFQLTRENFFNKFLGGADIDFKDYPEFSKKVSFIRRKCYWNKKTI
jgi:hypothetical protein